MKNNNRLIKFRVRDLKNKRFLTGNYFGMDVQEDGLDLHNGKHYIYQQFTGLKDGRGREIYEGDLINFTLRGVVHGPESEDIKAAEVWYSEEDAQFVFGRYKTNDFLDYWFSMADRIDKKSVEIVGNIYVKS